MGRTKVTSIDRFNKLDDDLKLKQVNALISLYADMIKRDIKLIEAMQRGLNRHEETLEELKEVYEDKDFKKFAEKHLSTGII